MFAAHGGFATFAELQVLLDPYLDDGGLVASIVQQAEASGLEFDDEPSPRHVVSAASRCAPPRHQQSPFFPNGPAPRRPPSG